MVKAKAKADRAAARLAAQASTSQPVSTIGDASLATTSITEDVPQDNPSQEAEENMESSAQLPNVEVLSIPGRMELLRSKSVVVGRFMQLLVPILVDVYAASVSTAIRIKTLTGILKTISFLESDGLKRVLMVMSILPLGNAYILRRFPLVCSCG